MPVVSSATLKTYFETGDRPTQAQFEDLIDTSLQSTTVFGRSSGPIVAVSGDYTASMITDTSAKVIMTAAERIQLAALGAGLLSPSGGDDTAAVQAAITALASTTGTIAFGVGTFSLNLALTGTFSKAVRFVGQGARQTILKWNAGASRGLNITYTDLLERPEVIGMSLTTTEFATGTALQITGPASASTTTPGALIEDVIVRGDDVSVDCWLKGIRLVQCWNAIINKIGLKGLDDSTTPFDQTQGIELIDCPDNKITQVYAYHLETCIRVAGSAASSVGGGDGLQISHFSLVGVTNGIIVDRPPTCTGFWAHIGHINAYTRCIDLINVRQFDVGSLELFKTNISGNNWEGVSLTSCDYGAVHDCNISCPGVTAAAFSIGVGCSDVSHSTFNNLAGQFWAPAASSFIVVNSSSQDNYFSNITRPTNEANIINSVYFDSTASKNNRCRDIAPIAFQDFAASDATPSVGNDVSGVFRTANAVGTLITDFDDVYSGQQFSLQFNDAKTTIQHNAGLILKGAVPCVSTANNGGFLHFAVDQAGVIRECSRSF